MVCVAGTQAMTLSLLGNIATQAVVLQAVKASNSTQQSLTLSPVIKLMVSPDSSLVTKAATLLGNLTHDVALRHQVSRPLHDAASMPAGILTLA